MITVFSTSASQPVYRAPTRELAETALLELSDLWGERYSVAIRSRENNWTDLSIMFDCASLDLHHQCH